MVKLVCVKGKWYTVKFIEAQKRRMLGKHHSEESKQKMRERALLSWTPERRFSAGIRMKGKRITPLGYRHSEETKSKIGLGNKGKTSPYKGVPMLEEQKQKISQTKKVRGYSKEYREAIRQRMLSNKHGLGTVLSIEAKARLAASKMGVSNPMWNGGISKFPYPFAFNKQLKEIIRKRDKGTCQICYKQENGREHFIHHIDYDKNNLDLLNLILICHSCHSKTNNHRKYWQCFLEDKQCGRVTNIPKQLMLAFG